MIGVTAPAALLLWSAGASFSQVTISRPVAGAAPIALPAFQTSALGSGLPLLQNPVAGTPALLVPLAPSLSVPAIALSALHAEVSVIPAAAIQDPSPSWDGAKARTPLLDVLAKHAEPWRTDNQLARLAAKPRAPGESFKFSVIGDAEPGRFWFSRKLFNEPGVFWRLLARANVSSPDFIMQLGDMVSRGTVLNFWSFIRGLASAGLRSPYLTVIGNHDRFKPHGITNDHAYRATFGATNYAFERGGWRFVVVDSSAGRITKNQLSWLAETLDPAVPTVVFTHVPPAPLGEWTDWGRFKGAGGFKEGSSEFMALMSKNKVARVYMGHIHGLGTLERGGVTYVLTGGGGSPLYPGPVKRKLHHWLSVEAGPNGLVETVHEADGTSYPLR